MFGSARKLWQKARPSLAWTWIARGLFCVILVWYVALGINTHRVFDGELMRDLMIYVTAFARALQGIDPYAYSDVWTAFLYPLPGLLIGGLFAIIPDFVRPAVFITSNLVMFAVLLYGVGRKYHYRLAQIWWWFPLAFGFAPWLELLQVGTTNMISSMGIMLMFFFAETQPALAGGGLVIATVTKLTPAVFFLYALLQRRFRVVVWGLVLLAAAFALSFALFGWRSPLDYLDVMRFLSLRFTGDSNSMALVTGLHSIGWMEQGAWREVQGLLLVWIAVVFAAAGLGALASGEWEPLFVVLTLGTVVSSNVMWYHHYVFILLPLFVWIAWSRMHPVVAGWIILGLTLIQVDRWYWTQGLLPHLFVHLSMIAIVIWQLARILPTSRWARACVAAGAVPALVIVGWAAFAAWDANTNLVIARQWLAANIPAGTGLAVESYGPFVDGNKYRVEIVEDLFAHSPAWYLAHGWPFVVTGFGTHGQSMPLAIGQGNVSRRYENLFAGLPLAAELMGNGHEIRVYKLNADLPSHAVYRRWGVQGFEWLGMLGYDADAAQWQPGTTGRFTFYWLALDARKYDLNLTVRLLDQADKEVGHTEGKLFGAASAGDRWPAGVVRVPWEISLPATAEPGSYHLQLEVDVTGAAGFGRVPLLAESGTPASDKLFLGPFQVSPVPPAPDEIKRSTAADVRFKDLASLQGYIIAPGPVHPGDPLNVTLYWRGETRTDRNYTLFVHLVDAERTVRAQEDGQPFGGGYPTSMWRPDELIRDGHTLTLPADLRPGDYNLEIGWYELPSLIRLPVVSAAGNGIGDHVRLDGVVRVTAP